MSWIKRATDYALGLDKDEADAESVQGVIDPNRHTLGGWVEQLRLGAEMFSREQDTMALSAAISAVWARAANGTEQNTLSANQRKIVRRCAKLIEALAPPLDPDVSVRLVTAFEAAQAELSQDNADAFDAVEYRLGLVEADLGLG